MFNTLAILGELKYKAVKSSGPGGQHVNKVNTCIELSFDIPNSKALNPEQKQILTTVLSTRITQAGILQMSEQGSRSQLKNKQEVTQRLINIIHQALKPRKRRIKTKATKASQLRRLERKKYHSEKKKLRRRDY